MASPLDIQIMLACFCTQKPKQHIGSQTWNSDAAKGSRNWLRDNGLIDEGNSATDRGCAWVKFICDTPLPKQEWALPDRKPESTP